MGKLSLNKCRAILFCVFLLALVVQFLVLASVRAEMRPGDLQALTLQLLGTYGVHLGVMIAGVFAAKGPGTQRVAILPFWIALTLSLLWNLLLGWFTYAFITSDSSVAVLAEQITSVSEASSFLVAGALAYFFVKEN